MAIQEIVLHPSSILTNATLPVANFNAELASLVQDLHDTLQAKGGIGLAAPQLGLSQQVFVTHSDTSDHHTYINPQIVSKSTPGFVQESCLSVPGIVGNVWRSTKIAVQAQGVNGEQFEQELTGMDAVCVQHEIDHLNGILFIERFSWFKKLRMRMSGG